ncbi:hypothetical protein ACFYXM_17220 [Streptomyces sp. NPDC002476]|uniref:hypothetical protein n=1 Tax=Streptomyces sp. NPDC002476 TaxID=3364648 RepID=UPI00367A4B3F
MDRSFRLRDEDTADYAAVLDEVIESAEIRRLLARSPLGAGELRVQGLAAAPRVAAAAEAEYRSYAELRQRSHGSDDVRTDRTTSPSGPGRQERTGAGLVPVLAVLTPVLAAVAAATFLLLGYGLRLADSLPATADTLVHAGWISLGTAASTAVIGLIALYRTAAEHKESTASGRAAPSADLDRAREAWLEALRDVGIRPFLVARFQEAHADPDPGPRAGSGHRPRFSSPDFGRPGFGSPDFGRPDFSSPDFAGPGGGDPDREGPTPDGRGPDSQDFVRPEFSRPEFGRPDFSGPDFSGPDFSGPDFSGPGLPDTRR